MPGRAAVLGRAAAVHGVLLRCTARLLLLHVCRQYDMNKCDVCVL
jgi:hypothetical protein